MSWLDLPRSHAAEEIDNPAHALDDLARSMTDLACTNRLFGGTQTILWHVSRLLRGLPPGAAVRVLDIGTGSGDIPRALQAWGRWRGLRLVVTGLDNLPSMLRLARTGSDPPRLVLADALALPFRPHSFDLALCALAFHHFGMEASAHVLAAMDRLTVRGLIVSDLRRDRLSLLGVQAALPLIRAHPFTRHDGPLSVRRAFSLREYHKIVALSGARNIRVSTHWYFRVALVQDKINSSRNGYISVPPPEPVAGA